MLLPDKANKAIKIAAVIIGVAADGIMLFICFTSQALDLQSKVAFGALGIMIILLIPITYNERAYKLWFSLVICAIFFDTSFLLAKTDPDNASEVATVDNDKELARLDAIAKEKSDALKKKQDEYAQANNGATLRELNNQIENARIDATKAEDERKARYKLVESGGVIVNPITSSQIFQSFPKAMQRGRQLQAFMYGLISIIIQGMIVFALSEKSSKKSWIRMIAGKYIEYLQKKIEAKIGITIEPDNKLNHELVSKFVNANWTGFRANKGKNILSQKSFMEFFSTRGGFSVDEYKKIKQRAIDKGIISPGDEIQETDENKAIMELVK